MNATTLLQENLFSLGKRARANRNAQVWLRADGAVWLVLGSQARPAVELGRLPLEITEVHYHPQRQDSPTLVGERLAQLRQEYPQARIHGLSPGWVDRHGLPDGLDSLCLFTGELDGEPAAAARGWQEALHCDKEAVATVVYGPEHSAAQLEQRLLQLSRAPRLRQVVLLPRAVGDLVVVPGATTDGPRDIEFLALARCVLPSHVRVRASWGALGFKLAQSSLAFGADALAGWGLEEHLAYSGKMRSADLIGWDEARAGVREAGRECLQP